jgi:hypothetical protein
MISSNFYLDVSYAVLRNEVRALVRVGTIIIDNRMSWVGIPELWFLNSFEKLAKKSAFSATSAFH